MIATRANLNRAGSKPPYNRTRGKVSDRTGPGYHETIYVGWVQDQAYTSSRPRTMSTGRSDTIAQPDSIITSSRPRTCRTARSSPKLNLHFIDLTGPNRRVAGFELRVSDNVTVRPISAKLLTTYRFLWPTA
jgi:hypothetical protein